MGYGGQRQRKSGFTVMRAIISSKTHFPFFRNVNTLQWSVYEQYYINTIKCQNSIDKSHSMWYSRVMKKIYKRITLPVLPGATPEWVVAQRREMEKRMLEEAPLNRPFKLRRQFTGKRGHQFMSIILEMWDEE